MVKLARPHIIMEKPIYVGFCILELSKVTMYEFHYDHIVDKYGQNARLLYTDTDWFIYHIQTTCTTTWPATLTSTTQVTSTATTRCSANVIIKLLENLNAKPVPLRRANSSASAQKCIPSWFLLRPNPNSEPRESKNRT